MQSNIPLLTNIKNYLTNHLDENNLTYCDHLKRSLVFCKELQIGAIKALVHSFVPFIFDSSTTELVNKIKKEIDEFHESQKKTETPNTEETPTTEETPNNKKEK